MVVQQSSHAVLLMVAALACLLLGVALPVALGAPAWLGLLVACLGVGVGLLGLVKLKPKLYAWLYIAPSVLFLCAFTVYPLLMTAYYSLTNYSVINSGRPDSSTQLEGKMLDASHVQLIEDQNVLIMRCGADGSQCADTILELSNDNIRTHVNVKSLEGDTFTLQSPSSIAIGTAVSLRKVSAVGFVGLEHYMLILEKAKSQLLPVLTWNILFAIYTTALNVLAGIVLGVLLHDKKLFGRKVYRALLILPWAVPGVISIQMWATLFNTNFGAINRLFGLFGVSPAPWLEDGLWAKAAILLVNLWLSFPYFMTATSSALSSISADLYESAEVDGATPWQRFWHITLPMIKAPFVPIVISSFAVAFNNINLIFLLTGGGPAIENQSFTAQSTDILLSWGYKTGFQSGSGQQYGFASAIAVVVGCITIAISAFNLKLSDNTATKTQHTSPIGRVLGWMVAAGLAGFFVYSVVRLFARLQPRSFAVLYPEVNPLAVLVGFVGGVALLWAITHGLRKLNSRRKVSAWSSLSTLATHGFLISSIAAALYPVLYVVSASLDPLNRLAQASLGTAAEPLLVRARVLPSLEGLGFANYQQLFEGVVWTALQKGVFVLAVVGIVLWLVAPAGKLRSRTGYTAIACVLVLLMSLQAGQFASVTPASRFSLWIRNTMLISGATGLLGVLLVSAMGYALARLRFTGQHSFLKSMVFLQMFPSLLGLIATFSLINALGLSNTFTGLILAYSGGMIAFGAWIYKGYVEALPITLDEAAMVDGATPWQIFVRITLPLTTPALVFMFLLQFIGTYTEFFLANVILTGAENWNVGVGLRSFNVGQFSTHYGPFAAAAVLGSLPIVMLFYRFQDVFVSGGTSGGVKE